MTLTDALGEGLLVTGIGLAIVFAVLIILMLVMMLMNVIFYHPETKPTAVSLEPAPVVQEDTPAVVNDDELIAVLTAAVAASLNTSTYHLNIKSYRRIENTSPAWNRAGLRDVIDARF